MLIQNAQTKIDLSDIADKKTQYEILEKVENIDLSGIDNSAQIEEILTNQSSSTADLESISKILIGEGGSISGYGTGVLGDVIYDPEITAWPSQDSYGRYIWNCTNFTLPEGIVMTPPKTCNGVYIFSTESCNINGTIDMRRKRKTLKGPNGISNFLNINNIKYNLAVGGNTVRGGHGGYGGYPARYYSTEPTEIQINALKIQGGYAKEEVYAGNVNGGGTSTYGTGAKGWANGKAITESWSDYDDPHYNSQGIEGQTSDYREATGALILACQSLNIGTTGYLNCEGLEGIAAQDGTPGIMSGMGHTCGMGDYFSGQCGNGGDGTVAPTGGGPITIITESFINNGIISTSGKSITSTSNGVQANGLLYDEDEGYGICVGGSGGESGTFISEAGELKIYIVGEQ